jgi:hypothetical protein
VKHNASDFAQMVLKIGKDNGFITYEQLNELAKQFKIEHKH